MVNGLRVARPLVSDMLRDQGLHSRNIPAPCGFELVRPARTGHLSESIEQNVQQPGINTGRNVDLGAMSRHELLNGNRTDESRGGKTCVTTGRARGAPNK